MAVTDLEQLNVVFNARFDQFSRQLARVDADYAKAVRSIQNQNASLRKRLSASFAIANPLKGVAGALGIGLSVAAVGGFVKSITESVDQIKRQSAALGISTDAYQEIAIAARQAEVSQDELNRALDKFASNLGEAQLHQTPFGDLMKRLGVDIKAGTLPAFFQLIDATNRLSVAQRDAVAKLALGKGYAGLAGFFQQGSAAIRKQMDDLYKMGAIIQNDHIEKIDEFADAWGRLQKQLSASGASVLTGVSDSLDKIVQDMGSKSFQDSLQSFGKAMGDVASYFVKISSSPFFKYLAAGGIGALVGGPLGAAIGVGGTFGASMAGGERSDPILEAYTQHKSDLIARINARTRHDQTVPESLLRDLELTNKAIERTKAALAAEAAAAKTAGSAAPAAKPAAAAGGIDLTGILDAEKMQRLAQQRAELRDSLAKDVTGANAALVAAQDELAVKLLTGQAGYHDAVMKMIDDETAAKKAEIKAEADLQRTQAQKLYPGGIPQNVSSAIADIERLKNAAADAAAQQKKYESGAQSFADQAAIDAREQTLAYKDQVANLGKIEGALAAAEFYQQEYNKQILIGIPAELIDTKALRARAEAVGQAAQAEADAARISQRSIQLQDQVRQGLEDVGVAGLHGFKSLKDAAAQFLEQLAEMIIRLAVMKPLIESLLGAQGGGGGGLFGGILSNIFGSLLGGGGSGGAGAGGYALGGVFVPGQGDRRLPRFSGGGVSKRAAIFGEAGPEAAVPLPDGRRIPVDLRGLPSARQLGRAAPVVNAPVYVTQNLDGAVSPEGIARISKSMAIEVGKQFSRQLRAEIPDLIVKAHRDNFP